MTTDTSTTTFNRTARGIIQFVGALPLTALVALATDDPRILVAVQGVATALVTALQNAAEGAGVLRPVLKPEAPKPARRRARKATPDSGAVDATTLLVIVVVVILVLILLRRL